MTIQSSHFSYPPRFGTTKPKPETDVVTPKASDMAAAPVEEKSQSSQKAGFFPPAPLPQRLYRPRGLRQRLAYTFNWLFRPAKVMTPPEQNLCNLVDSLTEGYQSGRFDLRPDKPVVKEDAGIESKEILIDGKPYTIKRLSWMCVQYHLSRGEDKEKVLLGYDYHEGTTTYRDESIAYVLSTKNRHINNKTYHLLNEIWEVVKSWESDEKLRAEMTKEQIIHEQGGLKF